jgi:hypothetical protein
MVAFKVVITSMHPIKRMVHSIPLRILDWFGNLYLIVAPLDDHTVVMGWKFLKLSKVVLVPHENVLVFFDGTKT